MTVAIIEKKSNAMGKSQNALSEAKRLGIPLDEKGVPIGETWETIKEKMYDNLSKHYGTDLRNL